MNVLMKTFGSSPNMKNVYKFTFVIATLLYAASSFALSPRDNLGDWRAASSSEQEQLSKAMVDTLNLPSLSPISVSSCITETAGNGGFDTMKIVEVAAACAAMLK